jgi:aspartate aminotransferase
VIVAGLNALGLRTPTPQGAFYVMADLTPIDADETVAATTLLERAHVGVVPGTDFEAPGFARLSYATGMEQIETALERMKRLLD